MLSQRLHRRYEYKDENFPGRAQLWCIVILSGKYLCDGFYQMKFREGLYPRAEHGALSRGGLRYAEYATAIPQSSGPEE